MLSSTVFSERAGRCELCERPLEGTNILVCLECGRHFCSGVGSVEYPYGHSRVHAKQKQHWVAALYDERKSAYCFKCEYVVCVTDPPGDHALELSEEARNLIRNLITELSDALGSAYVHGYAIRGIPNRGNTCYLSALVQCFLVLDKLRARMLGPDAPKGIFAKALTDLFVGTSAAGILLNPEELLARIRSYKKCFQGYEMHDSHELLMSLLRALNDEQNSAPTYIESIFGSIMYEETTCKCSFNSLSHCYLLDLSLALPSRSHPADSAATQQTSENSKSQLKKVATQLLPANEPSKLEKVHTVAESGNSHLQCSELKDVVVEETPGPLQVDSTEVQRICQSKDVQGPLQTQEDKVTCPEPELSQRITEVPVQSASLLPLSMSVKVEEMNEATADSVASIEYCLSLFHDERVEWRCDNCSKVYTELSTNQSKMDEQIAASAKETTTIDGDQAEQSDTTKCKNDQSIGSNSLSVESKFSSSRQPHGSDAQGQIVQTVDRDTGGTNLGQQNEDVSIQKMHQERKKQTEPDHSAYHLEDSINEQKDGNDYAIQTRRFIKLPSVLTLHLKRTGIGGVKISDHVRYKEYLDVGPYIDPSSVKDNPIYHLVGVMEHRGIKSVEIGHYVAYVRARKFGNPEQQAWFCADDKTISEVSLEEVLKREAYILFYERREG